MQMKTQHTKTYGMCSWSRPIEEKIIAVYVYIKKEERSQINNLTFHFKTLANELKLKQIEENKSQKLI